MTDAVGDVREETLRAVEAILKEQTRYKLVMLYTDLLRGQIKCVLIDNTGDRSGPLTRIVCPLDQPETLPLQLQILL
jgi:hypothetical protein